MRYEREHPGTLAAAVVMKRPDAWEVITGLLEQSSAAVGESPGMVLERSRISKVDDALSAIPSRYAKEITLPTPGVWRIHHLIPFAVVRDLPPAVQKAFVAAGWSMDRALNLIALPANAETYDAAPNFSVLPYHTGGHPQYNAHVRMWISSIASTAEQVSPTRLLDELTALEVALRGYSLARLQQVPPKLL